MRGGAALCHCSSPPCGYQAAGLSKLRPRRRKPMRWVNRQNHRRAWCLGKVEVRQQITQSRSLLPYTGSRVRATIRPGVDALTIQKVIFNKLEICIKAERLMINIALFGIGADDQAGYPQAIAVLINHWWHNMIVESTPVVPGEENGRAVPIRSLHDGVDEAGDVGLANADEGRWMFALFPIWRHPRNCWQRAILGGRVEIAHRLDVGELPILLDGVKIRQRVPNPWRLRPLPHGSTRCRVIIAVRLCARRDIIGPTHVGLMQQVGEVCPGIIGVVVIGPLYGHRPLDVVHTTRRVSFYAASRRPR